MARSIVAAALLLAISTAAPARADDADDCKSAGKLARRQGADIGNGMEACRRLAKNGAAFAQFNLGLLIAFNVGAIVSTIEQVLRVTFLPPSVYFISNMPSDPQRGDILPIVVISLVLSFIATLYPSWRASRVQPAEALRYE